MGLEPHGFRQWVCLHEQTHAAHFGAAPWLAAHLLDLMRAMFDEDEVEDDDPPRPHGAGTLLMSGVYQSTFDRITAVMSLLEGHADVIMDRAATGLVPQVALLRAAMEAHATPPDSSR